MTKDEFWNYTDVGDWRRLTLVNHSGIKFTFDGIVGKDESNMRDQMFYFTIDGEYVTWLYDYDRVISVI